ncbi:rCG48686, isoform CRA_b [Rattus norvegicus]|uniref:RCG48686, isoform CRA_b n=1 Tax=Rattus norvegicus TaxID=10116 RepID=A6IGJ7_RAT|nr:rCG48686, isoform CRA_b [Rattus norvegicus]
MNGSFDLKGVTAQILRTSTLRPS